MQPEGVRRDEIRQDQTETETEIETETETGSDETDRRLDSTRTD